MSDTDIAYRMTLDGTNFASGMQAANAHLHQMGISTNSATASLGPMGTILGSMASPLSLVALGATAVGGALAASVQSAAAWESSMAGVAKTTGMAGPALAELSSELLEMSTNIPIAASELASIAQAGGSLGIAKEELAGFTEVAAQMGVGFEMSAAQAATSGAKILTAFQMDVSAENLRNLGNVVNKMGDDFPATEAQVLEFTNRASYLNTTFGMSVPAVAAWGTALISAGMEAENASTGIKSLMTMSLDPKKFDAFAAAAGMSAEELKTALNEDVAGAYEMVAEKIAGGTDAVAKFQTVSKLAGTEGMTTLMKMGGAAYQGAEALKKANAEWENGTSLAKTFAAQSETVNAQWQMFTNTAGVAATELGTVLLPVVSDLLKDMTTMTKVAIDVGEAIGGWGESAGQSVSGVTDSYLAFMGYNNADYLPGGRYGSTASDRDQAAYAASQAATTYVDEWGRTFDTSDYKSFLVDKSVEAGTEAGASAGENSAKAYADANKKWIEQNGSQFEAGMALINGMWSSNQDSTGFNASQYTGKTKIGNFEYSLDAWSNDLITPIGNYHFDSTADMKSRFPAIMQDLIGRPLSEMEIAEMEIDTPTLMKLTAKTNAEVVLENLWDVADSQRSWMKYVDENKELAKSAGDEIIFALYNAEQEAIKRNDPTLSESLANVMKALAAPGSVSADIFNTSLADIIDSGLISASWSKTLSDIGLIAAKAAGQTIKTALLGELQGLEAPTLADLIKNPALEKSIGDKYLFLENTFLPGLKNDMSQMNTLYNTGFGENQTIAKNYVEGIEKLLGNHRDWFNGWQQDLLTMYQNQKIGLDDLLDIWNQMEGAAQKTDKTTEKLKDQTVGYDNLKKAIEGCGDCAVSEFGQWQEAQDGLFQDSYIGQGGQAYLDWKTQQVSAIAETQRAMRAAGGTVLGQDYTQSPLLEQRIKVNADMSPAEADKAAFEATVAAANPEMKVSAITQAAMDEVNRLVNYIITVNPVMSVQVQVSAYAGEIRAIVESEVRAALA